jgi:peptide/nickel transport system substrate-binding protein
VVRWLRSVDKTGPLSVRMRLRVPYPMLMRDLAISYPIRKAGTYGSLAEPARNRRAQYLTLNGLGPYRVVEFEKNGRVVFERHDGYPTDGPKGRAAIRRIVIEPIQDARDRVLAVERGTAHLATGIPAGLAEPAAADRGLSVLSGPDMRIGFLVMDAVGRTEADNPFTKLRVRRAVNHAIDRETLVRDLVKGGSRPIDAACHPRQFGCPDEVTRYAYDPAMARRLLAEAGYPDGFDVTLWAYREPAVADALVADLNAVGIRATLNYVDWRRTLQARRQGLIQLSFSTWGSGGTADAHAIASFFWPLDAERNFAHDPVVAVHIDRAGSVLVPDDRRLAYERAFTRIADQAYWAPLFTYTNTFVASPELFYPMAEDGVLRLFQASWQ